MPKYSDQFKQQMVRKLCGPDAATATALSGQTGVSQQTLSRWLRDAKIEAMSDSKKEKSPRPSTRRPQDWTAEERFKAVTTVASMSDDELGTYLRSSGLKSTDLENWKRSMIAAVGPQKPTKRSDAKEKKRIRELEKELRRKDSALAEASALLVLKKKAQAIWGDLDDNTA